MEQLPPSLTPPTFYGFRTSTTSAPVTCQSSTITMFESSPTPEREIVTSYHLKIAPHQFSSELSLCIKTMTSLGSPLHSLFLLGLPWLAMWTLLFMTLGLRSLYGQLTKKLSPFVYIPFLKVAALWYLRSNSGRYREERTKMMACFRVRLLESRIESIVVILMDLSGLYFLKFDIVRTYGSNRYLISNQ